MRGVEAGAGSTTVHALRLGVVLAVAAELGILLTSVGGPFAPTIRVVAPGEPKLLVVGGLVGVVLAVASVALFATGAPRTIAIAGLATGAAVLLHDTPLDPTKPPAVLLAVVAVRPAMAVVLLALALAAVATGRSRRWATTSMAVLLVSCIVVAVRSATYDPFFDPACASRCEPAQPLVAIGPAGSLLLRRGLELFAAAAAVATLVAATFAAVRSHRHRARLAIVIGAGCLAVESAVTYLEGGPALDMRDAVDLAATVSGVIGRIALAAGFAWWAARAVQTRVRFDQLADTVTAAESEHAIERLITAASGARATLTFSLPDHAGEVDSDGEAVTATVADLSATPVTRLGTRIATIRHAEAVDGPLLVRRQSPAMLAAIEIARLRATRLGTVRLVRESRARIVAAQDLERRRVERDLHDGPQQRILAAGIELSRAASRAEGTGQGSRPLRDAAEVASAALEALRRLARGVHPAILSQGLGAALTSLAEDAQIPVVVEVGQLPRVSATTEVAVYRTVAAVLGAATKSGASHLEARVQVVDDRVVVEIAFDGDAVDGDAVVLPVRVTDRVGAAGGDVELRPGPGAGLLVHAVLPCG